MSKLIASLGHIVLDPSNTEDSIERIAKFLNDMSDILTVSAAERVEAGSINSESIIQNSIDKKHVLNTNSSNLLDNPSFELVGLDKTNEVVKGGAAQFGWDIIDPEDTTTRDVETESDPYQGRYVARYRTLGQDATATITGSGDAGIIGVYNDGVIQSQQGETLAFSFQAKYTTSDGGSADYDAPEAGHRDKVSGFLQFRDKDGGILSTTTSPAQDITDTWASYYTGSAEAPANTSYVTAGIKILVPSGAKQLNIYYFDACRLASEGSVESAVSYFSGNQHITYASHDYETTLTYYSITGVYGNTELKDFTQTGGVVKYTGVTTKKFLVQFAANFQTRAVLTYHYVYLRVLKNSTAVAGGGTMHDNTYGNWLNYGTVFRFPRMTGVVIVELSTNDTLKLEYGLRAIAGSTVTNANFGTAAVSDGINLVITSLGI